jgi:hypothetical protein
LHHEISRSAREKIFVWMAVRRLPFKKVVEVNYGGQAGQRSLLRQMTSGYEAVPNLFENVKSVVMFLE